MWKVNEIFHSLQGEGFNTGTASVFIRLSGCNLHCTFCDTRHESGMMMSLPEVVEQVMQYPKAPLIVLTGGEPSLWIDDDFVMALATAAMLLWCSPAVTNSRWFIWVKTWPNTTTSQPPIATCSHAG